MVLNRAGDLVGSRVGILGGTFDPVHCGHLEVANRAMTEGALERVVFIPAGNPRLKLAEPSASAEHRLAMLCLATEGIPEFRVSEMELGRSGPTRTVDTLRDLRLELGEGTELVFILGLDVMTRFDEWVEPDRVVEQARLLAVSRPGYTGFDWAAFYDRNPYARGRVDCIESTAIDISASELRSRLASGAQVAGLLPAVVEAYIREKGLYAAQGSGPTDFGVS